MAIGNDLFYVSILLVAISFFFLGAWFYRFTLWYPRGGRSVTGTKNLIGKVGQIVRDNGTNMVVRVDGQNWNAKHEGNERPNVGDKVYIKSVNGLNLLVEEIKDGN
jgi:membrane protein implicated in regulation of membrane protease activity